MRKMPLDAVSVINTVSLALILLRIVWFIDLQKFAFLNLSTYMTFLLIYGFVAVIMVNFNLLFVDGITSIWIDIKSLGTDLFDIITKTVISGLAIWTHIKVLEYIIKLE